MSNATVPPAAAAAPPSDGDFASLSSLTMGVYSTLLVVVLQFILKLVRISRKSKLTCCGKPCFTYENDVDGSSSEP
jgi:hypothetical protein